MIKRIAFCAALVALMIACHTDPYGSTFYGANGPLSSLEESQLTYADTNEDGVAFHWAGLSPLADGSGIIYSFGPRPSEPGEVKHGLRCILNHICRSVPLDAGDQCLAMMPSGGGSAVWQLCDTRAGHNDVIDVFGGGALNADGNILYTERSGSASIDGLDSEGALWLAAFKNPLQRRALCAVGGKAPAGSTIPSCSSTGMLSEIQWVGKSGFIAGQGPGLVRGTFDNTTSSISHVAGAEAARHFALVGSTAVFIGDGLTVRKVPISGGTSTVVATFAASAVREVLDISCRPADCVALTAAPDSMHWDLWRVDLNKNTATVVRTFDHELTAAKISPNSNDVVAGEVPNIFVLRNVLH